MSDEAEVVTQSPKVMSALRGRNYQKVNGSVCSDNPVAHALAGADFDELVKFANAHGIDTAKYDALNKGQKRMNIGNRIRTLVKKGEVTVEQLEAIPRVKAPEPVKTPEPAEAEE